MPGTLHQQELPNCNWQARRHWKASWREGGQGTLQAHKQDSRKSARYQHGCVIPTGMAQGCRVHPRTTHHLTQHHTYASSNHPIGQELLVSVLLYALPHDPHREHTGLVKLSPRSLRLVTNHWPGRQLLGAPRRYSRCCRHRSRTARQGCRCRLLGRTRW